MRFFNTEGPVVAADHYCIDPLARLDLEEVLMLIGWKKYFVLHAPRQTGKTSTLLALANRLNDSGKYRCVYINVEAAQAAREDTQRAMKTILGELGLRTVEMLQDDFVDQAKLDLLEEFGPDGALNGTLVRWSAARSKPLVLLIDEIDCLIGDTLISTLRQLRSGYDRRPSLFPQSVILCGVRDVRDYRIFSSTEQRNLKGGSAFNIKAESLRLGDFSEGEVRTLLAMHEADTGQAFTEKAATRVWELTQGQPWLVNTLGYRACFKDKAGRDRARPIQAAAVENAREGLIQERVTHLDQLADKLSEDRVRRVIEPMLAGTKERAYSMRDIEYLRDLGLVARDAPLRIANPIYTEVVPRELTYTFQESLEQDAAWYVDGAGGLNVHALLEDFQGFFRENSEHWVHRFGYEEAGPQLVLQGFLQRVVNSGGRIEREYALGRGRTDLLILWPKSGERDGRRMQRHVIECKVVRERQGLERTVRTGLEQTASYMDRCGAAEGHLIVFDRTEGRTWEDKIYRREEQLEGTRITVWGA